MQERNEHPYTSALSRALTRWQQGQKISLTLAVKLMEEGYDVAALESYHLGRRVA